MFNENIFEKEYWLTHETIWLKEYMGMVLFSNNEIDNMNVDKQRFIEQTFAYFSLSREELEQLEDPTESLDDIDNNDGVVSQW